MRSCLFIRVVLGRGGEGEGEGEGRSEKGRREVIDVFCPAEGRDFEWDGRDLYAYVYIYIYCINRSTCHRSIRLK